MSFNPTLAAVLAFVLVSLTIAVVGSYVTVRAYGDRRRAIYRLRGLASETPAAPAKAGNGAGRPWRALPLLGGLVLATEKDRLTGLRTRLLQAGYFQAMAPFYYIAATALLTVLLGLAAGLGPLWGWSLSWHKSLLWALVGCGSGYLAPTGWLSGRVHKRQRLLRNALPDALDMLVLCLEGGISTNAAVQHVTDELQVVHPDLGLEMKIIQREMQLGVSAGEALSDFANRCGLADVRDLASVLLESDRYGASVAKALRIYADSARQERQQRAEETAQKAAVKILFPTLLCIFPAIFIVLLGPAAFQMAKLFAR